MSYTEASGEQWLNRIDELLVEVSHIDTQILCVEFKRIFPDAAALLNRKSIFGIHLIDGLDR